MDRDKWLSNEAKDLGLVDHVVTSRDDVRPAETKYSFSGKTLSFAPKRHKWLDCVRSGHFTFVFDPFLTNWLEADIMLKEYKL